MELKVAELDPVLVEKAFAYGKKWSYGAPNHPLKALGHTSMGPNHWRLIAAEPAPCRIVLRYGGQKEWT